MPNKIIDDDDYNESLKSRILVKFRGVSGCWEWYGYITKYGYGQTTYRSKSILANRLSWMLFNGELKKELDVCHHCDNPKCINPDHLFVGTASENIQDCFNKNRKSHKGVNHPGAKITDDDVKKILQLRRTGWTYRKLSDRFKISVGAVNCVINRRTWKHVDIR